MIYQRNMTDRLIDWCIRIFLLYPLLFAVWIGDKVLQHFCDHKFSKYDPDSCMICGKEW